MKCKIIKKINCKQKRISKKLVQLKQQQPQYPLSKNSSKKKTKHKLPRSFKQDFRAQQGQTHQKYQRQMILIKQCFKSAHKDSFNNLKQQKIQSQLSDFMQKFCLNNTNRDHPTVDMLLNRQFNLLWPIQQKNQDLVNYSKYLNYCLPKYGQKIILRTTNGALCLSPQNDRRQNCSNYSVQPVSFLQSLILENRSLFMEKIQLHEQKYSQESTRLSQISKETLLLLKIYKQNQDIAMKLLREVKQKISDIKKIQRTQNLKSYVAEYYEILINKNIRQAFNQQPIQRLNYFKDNQFREKSINYRLYNYKKIQNQQQFRNYLRKRKPKKGKSAKYSLPTACAACFSDYYQLSNPFTSCDNCFHRCHKLCLDLTSQKCGYCSYQRIPKQKKEIIPFCKICKKKDQMCIKLDSTSYAHAFCLLIHKFWRIIKINSKNVKDNNVNNFLNDDQNSEICRPMIKSQLFQMQKTSVTIQDFKISNETKFRYQDFHSNTIQHQPSTRANLITQVAEKMDLSLFRIQYFNLMGSLDLGLQSTKTQHLQSQNMASSLNERTMHDISFNIDKEKQQTCGICEQYFTKKLYLRCLCCDGKYHAYCAFFQGFSIKVQDNRQVCILNCQRRFRHSKSNSKQAFFYETNIMHNECDQQLNIESKDKFKRNTQSLKQKRWFILNQNRTVFEIGGQCKKTSSILKLEPFDKDKSQQFYEESFPQPEGGQTFRLGESFQLLEQVGSAEERQNIESGSKCSKADMCQQFDIRL